MKRLIIYPTMAALILAFGALASLKASVQDMTGNSVYVLRNNVAGFGLLHVRLHQFWGKEKISVYNDATKVRPFDRIIVNPGTIKVRIVYTEKGQAEPVVKEQAVTVKANHVHDVDVNLKDGTFAVTEKDQSLQAAVPDYVGVNLLYGYLYENGAQSQSFIWGISYGHMVTPSLAIRADVNVWYPYDYSAGAWRQNFTYPIQALIGVVWYPGGNLMQESHYLKAQAGAMVPVHSPIDTSVNLVLGWGYKAPFGHTMFGIDALGIWKPGRGTVGIGFTAGWSLSFF